MSGISTTSVRLPPEIHGRLRKEAKARGLSVQFLILSAVTEMLDDLVPVGELSLTRGGQAKTASHKDRSVK